MVTFFWLRGSIYLKPETWPSGVWDVSLTPEKTSKDTARRPHWEIVCLLNIGKREAIANICFKRGFRGVFGLVMTKKNERFNLVKCKM